MTLNEKSLSEIREEFDSALNQLFYLMEKKKTDQGDISLKISVNLIPTREESVDADGTISETIVKIPEFDYTISQSLKLTNKIKGKIEQYDKLVFDESTGAYHLEPVKDNQLNMGI